MVRPNLHDDFIYGFQTTARFPYESFRDAPNPCRAVSIHIETCGMRLRAVGFKHYYDVVKDELEFYGDTWTLQT